MFFYFWLNQKITDQNISFTKKKQESCVINGETTKRYFKSEKGTRQGDPLSANLFIFVLEIVS